MARSTIDITDPVDPAEVEAARRWAAERAVAAAALKRARARRTLLDEALRRDPARSAMAAVQTTRTASASASDALRDAVAAQAAAVLAAERYEANELANAQTAADNATTAFSKALAELLKQATTSASLTATIDGLALRARFRAALASKPPLWNVATIPFRARRSDLPPDPQLDFPALDDTTFAPLMTVLRHLDERVDAVVDLVTAEGVHQLVNGNPVRSGAALEIAATGSVPDELDIIRTPRNGHDLTHRVLLVRGAGQPAAWRVNPPSIAAVADPDLAALASTLMPNPARAVLVAERIDPQPGTPSRTLNLTAAALGLDAGGWLRLAGDDAELKARAVRAARKAWAATLGPAALTGRIVIRDPAPRNPAVLALSDLLTAANAVRRVLSSARALAPSDFATPSSATRPPDSAALAAALESVARAERHVNTVIAGLEAAAGATTVDTILDALLAASGVGVAAATPALDDGMPALAALRAQVAPALAALRARTAGGRFAATPGDPQGTLDRARERLSALCGSPQPLLIAMAAPAEPLLRADLGGGPVRLKGAERADLRDWLHDHARVRTATAAMQGAFDVAGALGAAATLDVRATQLPAADPDRWIEADPAPRPGVVSLVVARAYAGDLPAQISGLAIDAWTTTVAATTHATGLAFHYDEPDCTPPQAVLVAVAPDVRPERQPATWDLDTLLDVVRCTFATAAERAAAAELWPEAAVTLPEGGTTP